MARIIVPGNLDRIRFAPPGWRGTCRMCGSVVITETDDCNLGDALVCLIACPTPRCEGRIEVVSPGMLNGVHALAVE